VAAEFTGALMQETETCRRARPGILRRRAVLRSGQNVGQFRYRQSRGASCATSGSENNAQRLDSVATYSCTYGGTRVEYSATEAVNPGVPRLVVPNFEVAAALHADNHHPGRLQFRKVIIRGVPPSAHLSGGCTGCYFGQSRTHAFYVDEQTSTQTTLVAHPVAIFTRNTRILIAALTPGAIGRFRLYRADPNHVKIALVEQGCTPPGVTLPFADAGDPGSIPRVRCP
jgi:hypothetical protein